MHGELLPKLKLVLGCLVLTALLQVAVLRSKTIGAAVTSRPKGKDTSS